MSVRNVITATATATIAGAVALTALGAVPANASGGNNVVTRGSCSGPTSWKLKVGPENGRLQVEAEVDANRVGQTWTWALNHNGSRVGSGTATTAGASGSFTVRRLVPNAAGTDGFVFVAKRAATGETCRGTISF